MSTQRTWSAKCKILKLSLSLAPVRFLRNAKCLSVVEYDPILRAFASILSPRSMSRGYADDLAMVLHNLWREAPCIAVLFDTIAAISCLRLNGKKCVIIPLWRFNVESVQKLLRECVPSWKDFRIEVKAKYLGDIIGPGSDKDGWSESLCKYLQRCRIVRSSGLTFMSKAILYKMLAISVTQFQAQLRMPPPSFRATERTGIFLSIGGPFNAYPLDFQVEGERSLPDLIPVYVGHIVGSTGPYHCGDSSSLAQLPAHSR